MTRINVGIEPRELSNSHLGAEYRELPRLWRQRLVSKAPPHFTLGAGHVLWCAQYPGMLADRFVALVAELDHRGFSPMYREPPGYAISSARAPVSELARARPLLIERIQTRLASGKRAPRWTNREPPSWALLAVS